MKLFSEFGELADNVGKGRDCRDDIGDVFVVLDDYSETKLRSIAEKISILHHAVKDLGPFSQLHSKVQR